jgi:hypothetical protein
MLRVSFFLLTLFVCYSFRFFLFRSFSLFCGSVVGFVFCWFVITAWHANIALQLVSRQTEATLLPGRTRCPSRRSVEFPGCASVLSDSADSYDRDEDSRQNAGGVSGSPQRGCWCTTEPCKRIKGTSGEQEVPPTVLVGGPRHWVFNEEPFQRLVEASVCVFVCLCVCVSGPVREGTSTRETADAAGRLE